MYQPCIQLLFINSKLSIHIRSKLRDRINSLLTHTRVEILTASSLIVGKLDQLENSGEI